MLAALASMLRGTSRVATPADPGERTDPRERTGTGERTGPTQQISA